MSNHPGTRLFAITSEAFCNLLMAGTRHAFEVVADGLPADAHVVGARWDAFTGRLEVVIASAEFESIEGAAPQPIAPLTERWEPVASILAGEKT